MAGFRRTGYIWKKRPSIRERIVTTVCRALERAHGTQRLGNPRDSVADLVYIIVSNKTSSSTARRTFRRLKEAYQTWDQVVASPVSKLRSILRPAGLSRVKARQLWWALRKIEIDFGSCDLRALRRQREDVVHDYLTSLPGVSDKVAKCVMLYTMGAKVLPVDAHVHRIATRLGWTATKRADQCHQELEAVVPARWRYAFHVGCVLHGRQVCRPDKPLCETCVLKSSCEYYKKNRRAA